MQVFAYGSVPLKTYLPDGDVDLTVLGNTSYGSTLIDDIYHILQSEEQNCDAEFEVKDLQLINAEVQFLVGMFMLANCYTFLAIHVNCSLGKSFCFCW